MKFEEFERKIFEKGFGIVAMNHYSVDGKRRTYCVVLNNEKAFKSEGENSEEVFEDIYKKIFEENN